MKSTFLFSPVYLMAQCSALAQSANTVETAKMMTRALGEEQCPLLFENRQDDVFAPETYKFSFKGQYSDTAQDHVLVRVPCWLGAYNQGDMYVLMDTYGDAQLISFAVPQYHVTYADPETQEKVTSITVTGYSTKLSVVLSEFDPRTLEISEFNKSRGLGDASTSGVWRFEDGGFVLKIFSVDASYDGELNSHNISSFGEAR